MFRFGFATHATFPHSVGHPLAVILQWLPAGSRHQKA
jgi:hypothetical protein